MAIEKAHVEAIAVGGSELPLVAVAICKDARVARSGAGAGPAVSGRSGAVPGAREGRGRRLICKGAAQVAATGQIDVRRSAARNEPSAIGDIRLFGWLPDFRNLG